MSSKIEWTDETWNPMAGCQKVSPGCANCYATPIAHRLAGNPRPKISSVYEGLTRTASEWSGEAHFDAAKLDKPLRWRKPRRVFVNSMSDLFYEGFGFDEIAAVFGVMAAASRHTFQVLTKRPDRAREFFAEIEEHAREWKTYAPSGKAWQPYFLAHSASKYIDDDLPDGSVELPDVWPLPNVWLGVSVEDQQRADERIPALLQIPAAVRFLSCEPLLGPVEGISKYLGTCPASWCADVHKSGIGWVIVGGESGLKARPCEGDWIDGIVEQCREADVPVFVKQLGSRYSDAKLKVAGHALEIGDEDSRNWRRLRDPKGGAIDEWPVVRGLRVREFPEVTP